MIHRKAPTSTIVLTERDLKSKSPRLLSWARRMRERDLRSENDRAVGSRFLQKAGPIAVALAVPVVLSLWTLTAVFAASPSPASGALPGDPQKGAVIFGQNCASCHGANLEGGVGAKLNPIEQLPGINSKDPAALEAVVKQGHAGQGAYAGQAMPAFGGRLSSTDINDVVSYILQSNRQGPAGLSPVDLARSNVFWVTVGIVLLVLVTWLLSRYNMRWIARRANAGREK
jgi:mono/diheme cytochrome c family protein